MQPTIFVGNPGDDVVQISSVPDVDLLVAQRAAVELRQAVTAVVEVFDGRGEAVEAVYLRRG